jgi:2-dehydro-3-deoxygluconokinase
MLTKLPKNDLGMLVEDHFRACGVDSSEFQFVETGRMGLNFVEFGAAPRPSKSIYDRRQSAASTIGPEDFAWSELLSGARLAYTDGILPALSESCRQAALEFITTARRCGCRVAFDMNYREHLWSIEESRRVMSELLPMVDVLVANPRVFAWEDEEERVLQKFHDEFGCRTVALTKRQELGVLRCRCSSIVLHERQIFRGREFEIEVIDRFGAGDAWMAGFLFGLLERNSPESAMGLADAMCALQQTMPGDVAYLTLAEVDEAIGRRRFDVRR